MDLQDARILIVDDTPINIKVLGEALRSDYKISVATSGEQALKIASSDAPPDLILLDIVMSGMDGYEVCTKLKNNQKTEKIPVIFITAKSHEKEETKGFELGAIDYITKPISVPIVRARVHTHLELKRTRDVLENLSHLDGLTGIANRRRLDEFLVKEWNRAIRKAKPICFILLDIDYFKAFNDNYGHIEGDECLRGVVNALASCIRRPGDILARYGGEEFAVVLPDTDLEGAVQVAEAMRQEVSDQAILHEYSEIANVVTISIGVACVIPNANDRPAKLIQFADQLLYQAKKAGRNQVKAATLD